MSCKAALLWTQENLGKSEGQKHYYLSFYEKSNFCNTELMKKRLTGNSSRYYGDKIWIENSLMPSTWTYKEVAVVRTRNLNKNITVSN